MKISVVGTGYVGLVTGTCLSEVGNEVTCIDIDSIKIDKLKQGISPIHEEFLDEMIARNIAKNRLSFTTSMKNGIKDSKVVFIAVGTPSLENGEVDMSQVDSVAREIGTYLNDYKVIVNKSTVPVGSCQRVKSIIKNNLDNKNASFDVVSNPEFLREGTAVFDTFNGDRIVIGSNSPRATSILTEIYNSFNTDYLITNPESSEMIKYASNAFLATKISFINEIANLCEKVGADVREVAKGMGMDNRIGNKFLKAGIGFGGACFPKDVSGLIKIGEEANYSFGIIKEVINVNKKQRIKPIATLLDAFESLDGLTIGLLGLAFKPGTDDLREAPSFFISEELHKLGANIKAYDPVAHKNAIDNISTPINYCENPYETVKNCDAIILVTEWPQFKRLKMDDVRNLMKGNVLVDGRNLYNHIEMKKIGFDYYGVGIGSNEYSSSTTNLNALDKTKNKESIVV
ncbi:UDP-glucose dehydrogenase family protein [Sporosalibacterium faouarense]|uniref:UDP-glucose dehydrogenase family protein n=1 Tax=Sporosalibacterium faouarense TaxID=516123 RepID=UPI00141C9CE9|nr:UDP-glucose/GDP-mannose dehydrogenase family protein [Sporosalibacterium faouarense]MTI47424.1 UDP-glucose/GDP-mannose dehydrogenase family protein [Bacillota bacterium]